MTTISNPDGSSFVSAILLAVADIAKTQGDTPKILGRDAVATEKGSVILDLTLGIASGAAWDLIYSSVQRFRNRSDYNPRVTIKINNEEVTIEYIQSRSRQ